MFKADWDGLLKVTNFEFWVKVLGKNEPFQIFTHENKWIFMPGYNDSTALYDAVDTIFANTNTSYNPDLQGRSSGKSGADVERILAFNAIGRKDPVTYVNPWEDVLNSALHAQLVYHVTRENGTESAFTGEYDKHFEKGEYNCVNCKITLFTSEMKFDSGCGWPAFHSEHSKAQILRKRDKSFGRTRTEVRCSSCDSHLGHVFDDGPKEQGGERYCINSVCLTFKEEI